VKLGRNQCKKCFKYGHWGREYKAKPKTEEAYTAQKEESLLLLQATPLFQIHARLEAPSSVIPVNQGGAMAALVPRPQAVIRRGDPVGVCTWCVSGRKKSLHNLGRSVMRARGSMILGPPTTCRGPGPRSRSWTRRSVARCVRR
jgi:hypothetical protein